MPANQPFTPATTSTVGKSVYVAAVSTGSNFTTIDSTGGFAPSLMVTNLGTVTLFARMSREAAPVASSTDVPITAGTSRVFENPNPTGVTGVAAIGTGLGAGQVVFTPGQGGNGSPTGGGGSSGGTAASITIGTTQIIGGADTRVLFQDGTAVGEDAGFTYNKTTDTVTTGAVILTNNGALSTPVLTGTGTWITGGSATTTKPYVLIEPTGTTSTGWSTSGTGLGVNAASGFVGNLLDMQIAGVRVLRVGLGTALMTGNFQVTTYLQAGTDLALISNTSTIQLGAASDVILARDAANTLALRNGTTAQKFSVYNTFTDASNYERGIFDWAGSANVFRIGTEIGGTGIARQVSLVVGGTTRVFINTTEFDVGGNSFNIKFANGNTGLFTGAQFGWSTNPSSQPFFTILTSPTTASVQLGAITGSGAAVAQTLSVQGSSGNSAAAALFTIAGSDQAGTTTTGGGIKIRGGNGTSAGGTVEIWTSATTTPAVGLAVTAAKSVVLNNAAIATNATDGFIYIATCAGTPTGVPTAQTGRVAMVYDTTNFQFWIYDGAWKQPKTPAGAAIVTWQ